MKIFLCILTAASIVSTIWSARRFYVFRQPSTLVEFALGFFCVVCFGLMASGLT